MYKIKQEDLQAILNYLASRPYSEVAAWIQMLQWLEKIEETIVTPEEIN